MMIKCGYHRYPLSKLMENSGVSDGENQLVLDKAPRASGSDAPLQASGQHAQVSWLEMPISDPSDKFFKTWGKRLRLPLSSEPIGGDKLKQRMDERDITMTRMMRNGVVSHIVYFKRGTEALNIRLKRKKDQAARTFLTKELELEECCSSSSKATTVEEGDEGCAQLENLNESAAQQNPSRYSQEEDLAIKRGVESYGERHWAKILKETPVLQQNHRSSDSIRCRWSKISTKPRSQGSHEEEPRQIESGGSDGFSSRQNQQTLTSNTVTSNAERSGPPQRDKLPPRSLIHSFTSQADGGSSMDLEACHASTHIADSEQEDVTNNSHDSNRMNRNPTASQSHLQGIFPGNEKKEVEVIEIDMDIAGSIAPEACHALTHGADSEQEDVTSNSHDMVHMARNSTASQSDPQGSFLRDAEIPEIVECLTDDEDEGSQPNRKKQNVRSDDARSDPAAARTKTKRCGSCAGCKAPECGKCKYSLDMPRFGDKCGTSSRQLAAENGHEGAVWRRLEKNADIAARDNDGEAPRASETNAPLLCAPGRSCLDGDDVTICEPSDTYIPNTSETRKAEQVASTFLTKELELEEFSSSSMKARAVEEGDEGYERVDPNVSAGQRDSSKYSPEEDRAIQIGVEKFGVGHWADILKNAPELSRRSRDSIRNRWGKLAGKNVQNPRSLEGETRQLESETRQIVSSRSGDQSPRQQHVRTDDEDGVSQRQHKRLKVGSDDVRSNPAVDPTRSSAETIPCGYPTASPLESEGSPVLPRPRSGATHDDDDNGQKMHRNEDQGARYTVDDNRKAAYVEGGHRQRKMPRPPAVRDTNPSETWKPDVGRAEMPGRVDQGTSHCGGHSSGHGSAQQQPLATGDNTGAAATHCPTCTEECVEKGHEKCGQCKTCVQRWLPESLGGGNNCATAAVCAWCKEEFDERTLRSLADPLKVDAYYRSLATTYAGQGERSVRCPGCPQSFHIDNSRLDDGDLTCPDCTWTFCVACRLQAHPGKKCDVASLKCPRCPYTGFRKVDENECNRMTCECGVYFCGICMKEMGSGECSTCPYGLLVIELMPDGAPKDAAKDDSSKMPKHVKQLRVVNHLDDSKTLRFKKNGQRWSSDEEIKEWQVLKITVNAGLIRRVQGVDRTTGNVIDFSFTQKGRDERYRNLDAQIKKLFAEGPDWHGLQQMLDEPSPYLRTLGFVSTLFEHFNSETSDTSARACKLLIKLSNKDPDACHFKHIIRKQLEHIINVGKKSSTPAPIKTMVGDLLATIADQIVSNEISNTAIMNHMQELFKQMYECCSQDFDHLLFTLSKREANRDLLLRAAWLGPHKQRISQICRKAAPQALAASRSSGIS